MFLKRMLTLTVTLKTSWPGKTELEPYTSPTYTSKCDNDNYNYDQASNGYVLIQGPSLRSYRQCQISRAA